MHKHYRVTATLDGAPYDTSIRIRDHVLHGDEPIEEGGANAGPKAHEMLCASLASCTAITLRMYADRKKWPVTSIHVDVALQRTTTGPEVGSVFEMKVRLDGELTGEQRARVLQIAGMCPVHKTLQHPIAIHTRMG